MGTRAKRARAAGELRTKEGLPKRPAHRPLAEPVAPRPVRDKLAPHTPGAPPPKLDNATVVFGDIDHMPRYETVPDQFKRGSNPYCQFVSDWFFSGRKPEDMARLVTKPGIDRNDALRAIKAILGSFAPKHEHKEAACAYLLSEWFVLDGKAAP